MPHGIFQKQEMQKPSYHRDRGRSTRAAPTDLAAAVREFRDDNLSGAQAIARRAAALVDRVLAGDGAEAAPAGSAPGPAPGDDIESRLLRLGSALVKAHPAMAPLYNLFDALLRSLDDAGRDDDVRGRIQRAAAGFIDGMDEHNRAIARHFSDIIAEEAVLFTHSAGSTVHAALLHCRRAGRRPTVHCTESRPVCEGSALALETGQTGHTHHPVHRQPRLLAAAAGGTAGCRGRGGRGHGPGRHQQGRYAGAGHHGPELGDSVLRTGRK